MSAPGIWVRLPLEALKESGVSKAAAIVLSVVIDRCTQSEELAAVISTAYLIEQTGYSRAAVYDALKELFRLDLIAHERTGRASKYRLTRCVELYPRACEPKPKQQQQQKKKWKRAPSSTGVENEYMALANRFKDDPDEPLEGQLEFEEPARADTLPPDPMDQVSENVREWLRSQKGA